MARRCALNHLAVIKAALGALDRVARVVKVAGWIRVAPGFFDMPAVLNGESDLLVELWGERGRHARAAIGVAALSRNAPVETEIVVQVASEMREGTHDDHARSDTVLSLINQLLGAAPA